MTITSTPTNNNVIHIEGLDLAGKSTATNALLDIHPDAQLRRNALTPGNRIFEFADRLRREAQTPAEILGPLYVAATMQDLSAYSAPTVTTVQDSTILLRSLAFNTAIDNTAVVEQLTALLPRHPRFGISIVLTASIEARLDRLAQRYRDAPDEVAPDDLAVKTNPERFLRMEKILVELAVRHFTAKVIDTSGLGRAEVIERITELTKEAS